MGWVCNTYHTHASPRAPDGSARCGPHGLSESAHSCLVAGLRFLPRRCQSAVGARVRTDMFSHILSKCAV